MEDNRYLDEIERLEKERELLLSLLSPEEREQYENFKKRFSETDHSQLPEKPDENDSK